MTCPVADLLPGTHFDYQALAKQILRLAAAFDDAGELEQLAEADRVAADLDFDAHKARIYAQQTGGARR